MKTPEDVNRQHRKKWLAKPENRAADREAARERMRKKRATEKALRLLGIPEDV